MQYQQQPNKKQHTVLQNLPNLFQNLLQVVIETSSLRKAAAQVQRTNHHEVTGKPTTGSHLQYIYTSHTTNILLTVNYNYLHKSHF